MPMAALSSSALWNSTARIVGTSQDFVRWPNETRRPERSGGSSPRERAPAGRVSRPAASDRHLMDLRFSAEDEAFRQEAREWLTDKLSGEFAGVRGRGGPGDEHALFEERLAWERALGEARWSVVAWPEEYGGRGLSLTQTVIF